MAEATAIARTGRSPRNGWLVRLAGSRSFHRIAARVPGLRRFAHREGEALFGIIAGFCQSQILFALVETGIMARLMMRPAREEELAKLSGIPIERLKVLLRGGQALGLLRLGLLVKITTRGAAMLAVPGVVGMIRHHDILYRDMSDPVAFFRGEGASELAEFWPYVLGGGAEHDPAMAARYSRLMADSVALVVEDTLSSVDLRGMRHLLDVGGGTGVFLRSVARRWPAVKLTLFDLPAVIAAADDLPPALCPWPGSFRSDPFPDDVDCVSLIRILYDHDTDTVRQLLSKVRAALPDGGRVIISEPMLGSRFGDTYFALYCMAMRTGHARRAEDISQLLREAGFKSVRVCKPRRAFVTTVIEAVN